MPTVSMIPPKVVKVSAAYGRLYVSGPGWRYAGVLRGAAVNLQRNWVELSLTLDSLKALRQAMGIDRETFKRMLTPQVLRWAQAAGNSEKTVKDMHQQLAAGWRRELPWQDVEEGLRPFAHQEVMASVATMLDGAAFLCDMGTGKTRAALESIAWLMREGAVRQSLVIAPRSVMRTWEKQCRRWTPELIPVVLDGKVEERRRILSQPLAGRVYVINYDVVTMIKDTLNEQFDRTMWHLTADEMHKIKNPQAQWSKAMMEIAGHARWRLGQTGTPILNGAHDIWSQWYMVDLGVTFGSNYVQFRREWFDEDKYDFDKLTPKDGTLEGIGQRLRRRGLRYKKSECLDLPDKVYERVDLEMTPKQKAAYVQMEDTLVAELTQQAAPADGDDDVEGERYATAATQLVAILRLTQITSGFVNDENGQLFRFQPNPKLDALETIVREQITEQQIIVWAHYREDIRAITERLQDLRPVVIQGGQTTTVREQAEDDFQSGRARLLVGNPASGGLGLNLQAASLAIYYSQNYSLDERQQSEDRCHRAGSEIHSKVTYIDLIVTGTIDEVIVQALLAKKSVAAAVVDLRRMLGVTT